jgi:hypothetical protein
MTIPHGPLDILQAQEQVRHRGGDRRAHRGSNPGRGRNKSHGFDFLINNSCDLDGLLFFLVQKMKNSPLFSINEYIFQFFTKKDKEN